MAPAAPAGRTATSRSVNTSTSVRATRKSPMPCLWTTRSLLILPRNWSNWVRVATADPDYSNGFRIGFGAILSECSAIAVTYAQLDNDEFDTISLSGLDNAVLRSLVSNPNPIVAPDQDGLDAAATLQTQFKLLDIDYKGLFAYDSTYQVAWVVGARYGKLKQDFAAGFAQATTEEVLAESIFEGGGLKLGLEGQALAATMSSSSMAKAIPASSAARSATATS